MRAWLDHAQDLGTPFRGYYVATEFRHGRPQAGRTREFRQFGVEVIGAAAPGADLEVIALGEQYLRERGLGRLRLHLNSIGDDVCRPAYREELVEYFQGFVDQLDGDCRKRLAENPLRIFDCKVDGEKDFVLAAPTIADRLCEPCLEHFAACGPGWTTPASTTSSIPGWCAASTTTPAPPSNGSPRPWPGTRPAR